MSKTPTMLEGIRVTDMTTVMFGPYCTQFLSDMGADVVKIEPENGDNGRSIGRHHKTPGMGAMHMNINRGKRSVQWDFKSDDGKEKLRRLLATSDVFIHNIRASAIKRMGFDYESVRAIKPDIVYVHCTGFDSHGPDANLPAYDDIIQAASGIASLAALVNDETIPRYMPMAIADKVAGLYAVQGTLAAIIHKLRTGEGQFVEIPMFEAVTSFTLLEHLGAGVFPDLPRKTGYSRQISKTRQPNRTADGYISLAPYNDKRWLIFLKAVDREDILEDERLNTPLLRQRNRELLYEMVNEITPARTTQEWLDLMEKHDIPARKVNQLGDLFDDPQLSATGFFTEKLHPTEGRYYQTRPVVRYGVRPDPELGFAPHVGEHSREIEEELGLASSDDGRTAKGN